MRRFWTDDRAATAIEYGLIAVLIAAAVIGAFSVLTDNTSATFNTVATQLS